MNQLTASKFFLTLEEASQRSMDVNSDILKNEYEEFAALVFSECKAANDREAFLDVLHFTTVELSCFIPGAKKNVSVYLEKSIDLLEKETEYVEMYIFAKLTGMNCPLRQKKTQKLKWTVTKFDFVEWLYALHEVLKLNGGKSTLTMLFDIFCPIFGMNPLQFSAYFIKIKTRKKDERTTFLDMQKKLLTLQMEKSDASPSRK